MKFRVFRVCFAALSITFLWSALVTGTLLASSGYISADDMPPPSSGLGDSELERYGIQSPRDAAEDYRDPRLKPGYVELPSSPEHLPRPKDAIRTFSVLPEVIKLGEQIKTLEYHIRNIRCWAGSSDTRGEREFQCAITSLLESIAEEFSLEAQRLLVSAKMRASEK